MEKKVGIYIFFIIILFLSFLLIYISDPGLFVEKILLSLGGKMMCNTGGAVKIWMMDWVNESVIIKCECVGKLIKGSGWRALDSDWKICFGEITYKCYELAEKFEYYFYLTNKNYLNEIGSVILCPPNKWTG